VTVADIFVDNPSFFQNFDTAADQDLRAMQLAPGQPDTAEGVFTVSDPIVPDKLTSDRIGHFDPEIYDLRETSHLMKLLKVLLGGSGVGGLRKQLAVARMQNSFAGMHFLDLDRFYGALFGIKRTKAEVLPAFNPYIDPASSPEWDDIHSRDASYRDRLVKFAKAIPHGGSFVGMKMMAEALIGTECEIYESWSWIDEQDAGRFQPNVLNYTYQFLQNNVRTYQGMTARTWGDWAGSGQLFTGRTSQRLRSEWMLVPKRPLDISEQYEVVRVLGTFKPAGTSFTVVNKGLNIHTAVEIQGVAASSECWEIISLVTPNPNLNYNPYANALSYDPSFAVAAPKARPAFSGYQGEEWSLNGDIATVTSYALDDDGARTAGDDDLVQYSDGTTRSYKVGNGVMTAAQATASQLIADGVMTSVPYADARSSLNPSTVLAGATA
jgi:hypothetical protein